MSTRIHFIGVGGSGMSAVARLTAATGATVTGSDVRESAYFMALRDAGMSVTVGHDAANVDGVDAVVISTAVRESNPELARARELGIGVWHRSVALARALEGQRLVAVAGSHGKTTTSAMVAHVLHACGVDASYAVGARVFGIDGAVAGGYAGEAGIAVVEADESDGSFLRFRPEVAILTNVEPDHLDHHGTEAALEQAFTDFCSQSGTVVVCADDDAATRVAGRAGVPLVTYGAHSADVTVDADSVTRDGRQYTLEVPLPGAHNRLNAAAAWAAAVSMGVDEAGAAAAFATFAGTGRRFQFRGEAGGVRVIDDYAHHPTEVAALLAAARSAGAGHLVVLFEPMLFTRTQVHRQNFADALSIADADVILAPIAGDREDPIPGVDSEGIASRMSVAAGSTVRVASDLAEAARLAAATARPGDTVLTVGSGPVTAAADWILDALRERDHG